MILMGILVGTIIPMVRWADHQQRESEKRRLATLIVSNVLEEITAKSYEDIQQSSAENSLLSAELRQDLPASELVVEITELSETTEPTGLRVTVSLSWRTDEGQPARPVTLTTLVYRSGGEG